jgi:murein DD-endopeptidase MepM/ murein hydrolase activator NlpD
MTARLLRLEIAAMATAVLLAACGQATPQATPPPTSMPPLPPLGPTPLPTRTAFPPGTIFDYSTQNGDTLPAVAEHFNTTVPEILAANPSLPNEITTLPLGYPLRVPAYYLPLTGSAFHILPDSEVVNGPTASDFDVQQEVLKRPGFLTTMSDYADNHQRPGWEIVALVGRDYSINPRLLLALLENQTHALTQPFAEGDEATYPLGYRNDRYRGLYRQLIWAAELIDDGYYGWRTGSLHEIDLADGLIVRPDPWQNAGTVAVQMLFAGMYGQAAFDQAVSPQGFQMTLRLLWGDPFAREQALIPGNLHQPDLALPFLPDHIWDFSGGPHDTWGTSLPYGALDFAPPASEGGCAESPEWIAAPAAGVVTRSGDAVVILDLDGDGDERTGWVLMFFHVAAQGRIAGGTHVVRGDRLGHPSCEGGRATGTHFHIARRYNGEWLAAAGPLPFVMDGWVAAAGAEAYQGTLTKGSTVIQACDCTTSANRILYQLPTPAP